MKTRSSGLTVFVSIALFGFMMAIAAHAQPGAESSNMRLVGYSSLQARTAYQPTIAHQGSRWIAYVGHHGDRKPNLLSAKLEDNGTSIVDVTDPANPKVSCAYSGR